MRACCLIRPSPHYRRHAFCAGLERAGYKVTVDPIHDPRPDDVLVVWNRYGTGEENALRFEKAKAAVLVAENGYIGRDAEGRQFYALARSQHNGAGWWPDRKGGQWIAETETYGARWRALGIEFGRIRAGGQHVLVCPSRGIGPRGVAMPLDWEKQVVAQLRRHTKRPIRVRPHPCDRPPKVPLAEDLQDCWAVVIWNSAAGVHALVAGVQVIACAPHWILKPAAPGKIETVDQLLIGEREPAFERLAWAQWSVEEIERGEPFRHLLSPARQDQVSAAV